MTEKNLVEIEIPKGKEDKIEINKRSFISFLKNTNLKYDEKNYELVEKKFFGNGLADIYIYEDSIIVKVENKYLSRVKRLFDDFVKFYKIPITIKIGRNSYF